MKSPALIAVAALAACAGHSSKLHQFSLVRDPSQISVYGLSMALPTERVARLMPILNGEIEPIGGVGFDSQARVLFSANHEGVAQATGMQDHAVLWRHVEDDPLSMPPLFIGRDQLRGPRDLVVLGTQNGRVVAVDADNGREVWHYDLGGELRLAPTLTAGRLLVNNSRNQLVALDPATGKWLWQYSRDFPMKMTIVGHSGVAIRGNTAFVGFSDGNVSAVRLEDGGVEWTRPLSLTGQGYSDADATPVVLGSRLFAASYDGGVYALNAATGEVLWQLKLDGATRLFAHEPYVFAGSASGELQALEAETGRTIWRFRFPAAAITRPIAYRGYLAFGARPGGLFVLEQHSGRLVQRFNPGGVASELAFQRGQLGFLSEGSFVYSLRYGEPSSVSLGSWSRFDGL